MKDEKTAHTPGPWIAEKGAGWLVRRPDAIGRREVAIGVGMTAAVTLVTNPDPWENEGEAEANARLMAASPQLIQALQALLEATPQELCGRDCDEDNCPWMQARAAIKLAKGGKP